MQSEQYRQNLKEALKNLEQVDKIIFQSIIDVAMQGELKSFNDDVPINEVHELSYQLFKGLDDKNVQLLLEVIDKIDEVYHSIANLNSFELGEQ